MTALKSMLLPKGFGRRRTLSPCFFLLAWVLLLTWRVEARWVRPDTPTDTPTVEYRDSSLKTDTSDQYLKNASADSGFAGQPTPPDQESANREEAHERLTTESSPSPARVGRANAVLIAVLLAVVSVIAIHAHSSTKGSDGGPSDPRNARLKAVKGCLPDAERLAAALGTKDAKDILLSAKKKLDLAEEVLSRTSLLSYVEGDGARFERCMSSALKSFGMLHDAICTKAREIVHSVAPVAEISQWATEAARLMPQYDFLQACKSCLKDLEDVSRTLYYRSVDVTDDLPAEGEFYDHRDAQWLRVAHVHLEFIEQTSDSLRRFSAAAAKLRQCMLVTSKAILSVERRRNQRRRETEMELVGQMVLALHEERIVRHGTSSEFQMDFEKSQEIFEELKTLNSQHLSVLSALEETEDIQELQKYDSQAAQFEELMDIVLKSLLESGKDRHRFNDLFDRGSVRFEECLLRLGRGAVKEGQFKLEAVQRLVERLNKEVAAFFRSFDPMEDGDHFVQKAEVANLVTVMKSVHDCALASFQELTIDHEIVQKKLLRIDSADSAEDLVKSQRAIESASEHCIELMAYHEHAKLLLMEFELLMFLEEDMTASFQTITRANVQEFAEGSSVRQAIHTIKEGLPAHLQAARNSGTLEALAEAATAMRRSAAHLQLLVYNGKKLAARRHSNASE